MFNDVENRLLDCEWIFKEWEISKDDAEYSGNFLILLLSRSALPSDLYFVFLRPFCGQHRPFSAFSHTTK